MKLMYALFVLLGASPVFANFDKPVPLTLPKRGPASAAPAPKAPNPPPAAARTVPPAAPASRTATQTFPFTQKNLGPKGYLKPTMIGGCCLLMQTRVRVETLEGKSVHEEVIPTFETFTLTGLKSNQTYNLILMHPRYKTPLKLEKVHVGNWINFRGP